MKKIILFALSLLVLASVSATLEIDVDCDAPGWWNTNHCQDYELEQEFDQVEDAVNQNTDDIGDTVEYISIRDAAWSKDEIGGGTSFSRVERFLFGSFLDFLYENFITHAVVESLHLRMDRIEAIAMLPSGAPERNIQLLTTSITAKRLGETQTYEDYSCFATGVCVKII